ncbi:MAG: glycosyltransferase family 4 protein [bacterium]|nr:glycosyltransferase family 4 protein [bacterium]
MKKTLLITFDFFPSVGGVSYYWMKLAHAIGSSDFVVMAPPLPAGVQEMSTSYPIVRLPFLSRVFRPAWVVLIINLLRVIKTQKPDVVIVGQILPVGTAVWILSFFMKLPYVVSCHGMDIVHQKSTRKRWLMKSILSRASAVIVNSHYTANALESLDVSTSRISYVYPCPVNTPTATSSQSTQYKTGHTLLTVCRLVPRKGHEYVIQALPEVLKKYPDTHYVIVGDGPYQQTLHSLVKELGLETSVRFMGALPDQEVRAWYGQADVFVMTPVDIAGDVEGFGIVYLEANAFALPVIATATGGVEEAVIDGQSGIVVRQGEVSSISQAIVRLFDDPEYAHVLGRYGKERVLRDFSWNIQARNLINVIDRVKL